MLSDHRVDFQRASHVLANANLAIAPAGATTDSGKAASNKARAAAMSMHRVSEHREEDEEDDENDSLKKK